MPFRSDRKHVKLSLYTLPIRLKACKMMINITLTKVEASIFYILMPYLKIEASKMKCLLKKWKERFLKKQKNREFIYNLISQK